MSVKTFLADNGVMFRLRVLLEGDKYGRDDCLTHEGNSIVEFYDSRYTGEGFNPIYGQFVSRYYRHTLANGDITAGLILDGGIPEWRVDADTLRAMLAYADGIIETRQRIA